MTPTAQARLRARFTQILRCGLYAALSRYLPTEPVMAYHRCHGCRTRRFTPLVTVWALVHQVLTGASDAGCAQQVSAWLGAPIAPRSGSYTKARVRLPRALVADLARRVGRAQSRRRRPWYILDGTTVPLADTPANQARFPQPPQQAVGCGFPVARVVVLMAARTGAVVDWEVGDLETQDAALARPLWDQLPAGAVVVADRGFSSYAFLAAMRDRGVDVILRQHESRGNRRPGRARDWDETWTAPHPSQRQPWWQVELPARLTVRVIWHRLPSGRWLKLNTTLSRRAASTAQVVEAYRGRWRIETQFEALKIGLRVEPLAATQPELGLLTLAAAFLALNLVCAVRAGAARRGNQDPWRVSLGSVVGALVASLRGAWRSPRGAWRWVLDTTFTNPHRPGRQEPRVRKRRPKEYPLMTHPRHAFQDQLALGRA